MIENNSQLLSGWLWLCWMLSLVIKADDLPILIEFKIQFVRQFYFISITFLVYLGDDCSRMVSLYILLEVSLPG